MQRSVAPRGAGLVGELLQRRDGVLGDARANLGVRRIAEVDATAERAFVAGGAKVVHLEGATVPRHGLGERRRGREQNIRLELTEEQCVAVLGEAQPVERLDWAESPLRNRFMS